MRLLGIGAGGHYLQVNRQARVLSPEFFARPPADPLSADGYPA
jgi:hypothetical protein